MVDRQPAQQESGHLHQQEQVRQVHQVAQVHHQGLLLSIHSLD
jgi:hypothetical protein